MKKRRLGKTVEDGVAVCHEALVLCPDSCNSCYSWSNSFFIRTEGKEEEGPRIEDEVGDGGRPSWTELRYPMKHWLFFLIRAIRVIRG